MPMASSGVSATAVSPILPSSLSALIMWKTTPFWQRMVEVQAHADDYVEEVLVGESAEHGDSTWSLATRNFAAPRGEVNLAASAS